MAVYADEDRFKAMYAELNDISETYEQNARKTNENMKIYRELGEKLISPSTSKDEKARLSAIKEKLEPVARSCMDELKLSEERLHQTVATVVKKERKSVEEVLRTLAMYHKNSTTQRIIEQLKFAQSLDIAFVFDVTGSMSPYIKELSSHIRGVLEDLGSINRYLRPRLGLVGYRDPEDGDNHFDIYPFHESVTKFEEKLKAVESLVGGGDDACEDVIGALQKATVLQWRHQNRLLILCADAPCHGKEYHDFPDNDGFDNHREGLGFASEPLLHDLIEKGVAVIFWKINYTTDKMIRKFNEEASRSPTKRSFPGDRPRDEYISSEVMADMRGEVLLTSMRSSLYTAISASISSSMSRVKGSKTIGHSIKRVSKMASIPEELCHDILRTSNDVPLPSPTLLDAIERAGERRL